MCTGCQEKYITKTFDKLTMDKAFPKIFKTKPFHNEISKDINKDLRNSRLACDIFYPISSQWITFTMINIDENLSFT